MTVKTYPFYASARDQWLATQDRQIKKGLAKYPEAFNPFSWTPQQLVDHALEESVDLTHYLVGLKTLIDAKDAEIVTLKEKAKGLRAELEVRNWLIDRLNRERERADAFTVAGKKPSYFDLDDE